MAPAPSSPPALAFNSMQPTAPKSFTDTFIRHPVLAGVVNLFIVLVGLLTVRSLPVQQYPQTESTQIIITTAYIGASAETIKGFLTTPIERAVSAIAGVEFVESSSTAGVSMVTVRLVLNHNATKALAEINARLAQVRGSCPRRPRNRRSRSSGPTVRTRVST